MAASCEPSLQCYSSGENSAPLFGTSQSQGWHRKINTCQAAGWLQPPSAPPHLWLQTTALCSSAQLSSRSCTEAAQEKGWGSSAGLEGDGCGLEKVTPGCPMAPVLASAAS